MLRFSLKNTLMATIATSTIALTTGCGIGDSATPTISGDVQLSGTVHGGQQPISGAHIYLMAAATSGYGAASTSLITSGDGTDSIGTYVLTSATGNFNLTGKYTCTPGQQVYTLSVNGNPGLGSGKSNSAAILIAALGACPSDDTFAGHISNIAMSELSTVAAVYALSGYMTDYQHVASANTTQSKAGLAQAFSTITNLVSLTYGNAYTTTPQVSGYTSGLSANGTVPTTKINTLANIIAGCINSDGTGNGCTQLFKYAVNGSTKPSNTVDALVNIAHNPSTSVSNLSALNTATSPFQPSLTTTPNDWTISIKFTVPNSSVPGRAAVDANGNIWIPNSGNNTLTELSPLGAVISGKTGYTGAGMNQPITPSFDSAGNVYVANMNSGVVSKFTSAGSAVTSYASSGNTAGYGVTIDPSSGNIWHSGNIATNSLSSAGSLLSSLLGTTYNTAVIQHYNGNFWSTSYDYNQVNEYSGSTVKATCTGGGLSSPTDLAQDSSSRLWISNTGSNSISLFNSSCVAQSSTGYTGGGINSPWVIAVDGNNNVWVGNNNGSISELTTSGTAVSPTTGFTTASTNAVYGLAVDNAGNLWVPNTDGSIYQFIGAAVPVSTPLTKSNAGVRP